MSALDPKRTVAELKDLRARTGDENGAWRNELDENMHQGTQVWPGRPDVYHCTGALTTPLAV